MTKRCARVVEDLEYVGLNHKMVCESTDVLTALQREHAATKRKVKALDRLAYNHMSHEFQAGQHNAYMQLLAWLDERGR